MKKNLLSVLILALMIVNVAISVITMVSITGTNKKTAALVDTIATVLNLELVSDDEDAESNISLADTEIYTISDAMTIPLKPSDDGKTVHMLCKVSLSINMKDEDYKTYNSTTLETYEEYIKQEIEGVVSSYTMDYLSDPLNREDVKKEVLEEIQKFLGSKVVYDIAISDVKFG